MSSKPTAPSPVVNWQAGEDRGINAAKVPAAIDAFAEYKQEIANTFESFKSQITKYDDAFFGANGQVKKYVDGVMDKCSELLQTLDELSPKLEEAKARYLAEAGTIYGQMG